MRTNILNKFVKSTIKHISRCYKNIFKNVWRILTIFWITLYFSKISNRQKKDEPSFCEKSMEIFANY